MKRRERTRHLIELGGLVVKSGLVELTKDDRTALYGAFLELVLALKCGNREHVIALWQRQGSRAFRIETEAKEKMSGCDEKVSRHHICAQPSNVPE